MSDPTLLYCVGATKVGTSWLYRHLHDHPECHIRAVKEAHYWDTFDADALEKQLAAYENRLSDMQTKLGEAEAAGRGWQVRNMTRQIANMDGLLAALRGDRAGDLGYAAWLLGDVGDKRLVADMTPNYAVLPDTILARMVALTPAAKFVFLIRDPLDRMWSHIRMQARRFRQDHEVYAEKANNILWRILNVGQETHILERGDYPAIISKLRRVVPEGQLLVQFAEDLFTVAGVAKLSAFLGIDPRMDVEQVPVHAGEKVVMRDDLRPQAVTFLKDHYDWVARNVGPLPQTWQDNLQRAVA